tara:strand:- start:296 stop:2077 length:1782 start_codon:yes stop_codon:yes gene_type:complete
MDINNRQYTSILPKWSKIRDVVEGEDAVKDKGAQYLPMLASQSNGDTYGSQSYASYKMRADFFAAAGRTAQGLVGAIMAKEPAIEGVPDGDLVDLRDSLGLNYEDDQTIAAAQVRELVTVGRYFLLVDKGSDPESLPYVLMFRAEDVTDWETSDIAGRETLTRVILTQTRIQKDETDPLGVRSIEKVDLLVLRFGKVPEMFGAVPGFDGFDGAPEDVYWQEIWKTDGGDTDDKGFGQMPSEIRVPTKNGGRFFEEIPGDIVNAIGGVGVDVESPPMLALANKVLAHYRESADLSWGRHMCAIPQPYITGYSAEDESQAFVMGCGSAWVFPDSGTGVGFLEFTGSGLGSLEKGQEEKKAEAAVLGSRMLEERSGGVEAFGTVKLRQSGDRSVLATIAQNVSQAMTRAVQRYMSWRSPAFDSVEQLRGISYELSCDFDNSQLDASQLTAYTAALQDGSMSWETFAFNMRRGEMLPPGVTDEEERDRIQMGAPGRSRKDEALMLQGDVREGRISKQTYLESLQKLGYLAEVDLVEEADRVFSDKAQAAEVQMLAFQQRGGFGGAPGAEPEPFGDGVADPDEPAEEEPVEDDEEADE